MISTGNDIVALNAHVVAKAAQPRYYSKILSAGEKDLYDEIADKELSFGEYVWLLWSVKESVHKFLKRKEPSLLFSPQKIIVQELQPPVNYKESWRCKVLHGEITIYTQTFFHSSFLHTVAANNKDFIGTNWQTCSIDNADYQSQSAAVRSLLAKKINDLFPTHIFILQKSADGIPLLVEECKGLSIPVSLSHDGHFIGYSFYMPPTPASVSTVSLRDAVNAGI